MSGEPVSRSPRSISDQPVSRSPRSISDQPVSQSPRSISDQPVSQLGIDVGGTSIKGAVVDLRAGELTGRIHIESTPATATPGEVVDSIRRIAAAADWSGPVGVALPGVIVGSSLRHAPNLSTCWQDDDALACLRAADGAAAVLINDADAAGLAELTYGDAATSEEGLTIVLTFGTGIGSALLHNGDLIANSELGGLVGTNGRFEEIASGRAISTDGLTPTEWARRAQPFFDELEAILNPSGWVVGGGLSENFDRFASRLSLSKPISVAHLGIHAGIVGAALAVSRAGRIPAGAAAQ